MNSSFLLIFFYNFPCQLTKEMRLNEESFDENKRFSGKNEKVMFYKTVQAPVYNEFVLYCGASLRIGLI